jgi:hypothetical protein
MPGSPMPTKPRPCITCGEKTAYRVGMINLCPRCARAIVNTSHCYIAEVNGRQPLFDGPGAPVQVEGPRPDAQESGQHDGGRPTPR